ncbi:MAG: ComEC/Rec2 family competence protein [Verrucomicrobiales bacterium]|nr:ComEC/Rec2 family competence protein [Verrucomicrobiales bacterium]
MSTAALGPPPTSKGSWRTAAEQWPLGICAIAAVVGILLADRLVIQGHLTWVGIAPCLFAVALMAGIAAGRVPPGNRRTWVLALAAGCGWAGLHAHTIQPLWFHPVRAQLQPHEEVRAEAEVEIAWPDRRGSQRAQITVPSREIRRLDPNETLPGGGLMLRLPGAHVPEEAGWYEVRGVLRRPQPMANPGAMDPDVRALRAGVVAEMSVDEIRPLESSLAARLQGALRRWAERSRWAVRDRLALGVSDQPEAQAVVAAVALGASDQTDAEVQEAFRRSGTLHVFAVSGLHVGLVSFILWSLLRWTGCGRRSLVLLVLPLVLAYAFITGWRPSAARAGLMLALIFAAILTGRQNSLLNSLGAAALLLLVGDTEQLFQPGFQLSFVVLLAIALLAPRFQEAFRPWTELDAFLPPALANRTQRMGRTIRRFIAGLFCVSTAAWLGSLPLMLWHFQTFTPSALLANGPLVPMAFVCLLMVCLSLGLSLLHLTSLQILANKAACGMATAMVATAGWFADAPGGSLHLSGQKSEMHPGPWQWQAFALGSGAECHLLRVGDHYWLLDAADAGGWQGTVSPAIRQWGLNHVDGLILSHGDAAHAGGARLALPSLTPQGLYFPGHEPWPLDSRNTTLQRLLRDAADAGGLHPLWRGDAIELGRLNPRQVARAEVLYPGPDDRHSVADDRGLVLRLDFGGVRILWVADAGFITETTLVERGEDLRSDVLIRGAHESDFHGTERFLKAVSAQVIITTDVPESPELRLPARVERFAADTQTLLLRQPTDGAISLYPTDSGELGVETHRPPQRWIFPLQKRGTQGP